MRGWTAKLPLFPDSGHVEMVKTRADGKRLLVYTDGGNLEMKEAYAYSTSRAHRSPPRWCAHKVSLTLLSLGARVFTSVDLAV